MPKSKKRGTIARRGRKTKKKAPCECNMRIIISEDQSYVGKEIRCVCKRTKKKSQKGGVIKEFQDDKTFVIEFHVESSRGQDFKKYFFRCKACDREKMFNDLEEAKKKNLHRGTDVAERLKIQYGEKLKAEKEGLVEQEKFLQDYIDKLEEAIKYNKNKEDKTNELEKKEKELIVLESKMSYAGESQAGGADAGIGNNQLEAQEGNTENDSNSKNSNVTESENNEVENSNVTENDNNQVENSTVTENDNNSETSTVIENKSDDNNSETDNTENINNKEEEIDPEIKKEREEHENQKQKLESEIGNLKKEIERLESDIEKLVPNEQLNLEEEKNNKEKVLNKVKEKLKTTNDLLENSDNKSLLKTLSEYTGFFKTKKTKKVKISEDFKVCPNMDEKNKDKFYSSKFMLIKIKLKVNAKNFKDLEKTKLEELAKFILDDALAVSTDFIQTFKVIPKVSVLNKPIIGNKPMLQCPECKRVKVYDASTDNENNEKEISFIHADGCKNKNRTVSEFKLPGLKSKLFGGITAEIEKHLVVKREFVNISKILLLKHPKKDGITCQFCLAENATYKSKDNRSNIDILKLIPHKEGCPLVKNYSSSGSTLMSDIDNNNIVIEEAEF